MSEDRSILHFSERQRATIAAALTILAGVVIVWLAWTLCVLLARFVGFFSGVLLPLVVAGVLAMLLQPLYRVALRYVRKPFLAVAVVFALALLPLGAGLWFFGSLVTSQVSDLLGRLPDWWDRAQVEIQQRWPRMLAVWKEYDLGPRVRRILSANTDALLQGLGAMGGGVMAAGAGLFRMIAGMLGWLVLPVYLAYFLMAPPMRVERLEQGLPFLKPGTRADVVYLVREFVNILLAYFRGQVLVALIQAVLYAAAFAAAGVPYGVAVGLITGLLNVVPYLGSAVGFTSSVSLAFFQGGGPMGALAALAAFLVVQGIESYLVTPRIMGQKTGLHPLAIMVAIFFWGTALGGLLGVLLAVPLTAFVVVLWRLLKAKYIREIV